MNSCLITPVITLAGRFRGLAHAIRTLGWTALAAGMLGQAQAQSRPAISRFTPAKAPTTALVTITGSNFDRDINGSVWTGTPPYTVQFGGSGDVIPTFAGNKRILVLKEPIGVVAAITPWAASHRIPLVDLKEAVEPHILGGRGNPDGIHWNFEAHCAVAELMLTALAEAGVTPGRG